eukprot:571473-Pyramimonas_sp.AAC.1
MPGSQGQDLRVPRCLAPSQKDSYQVGRMVSGGLTRSSAGSRMLNGLLTQSSPVSSQPLPPNTTT